MLSESSFLTPFSIIKLLNCMLQFQFYLIQHCLWLFTSIMLVIGKKEWHIWGGYWQCWWWIGFIKDTWLSRFWGWRYNLELQWSFYVICIGCVTLNTATTTTTKHYSIKWVWLHGSNYVVMLYHKPYFDQTH